MASMELKKYSIISMITNLEEAKIDQSIDVLIKKLDPFSQRQTCWNWR